MSSWSGTSRQTRAVFGCSLHPEYIDRNAFEAIYNVASLVPAVTTTLLEPAIRYGVPVSAVRRPLVPGGDYSIISEMDGSLVEPILRHYPTVQPQKYSLVRVNDRRSIDGLTIHYDNIERSFSVLEDASFSDVKLYHTRKTVDIEAWGRQWKFHFREVYYCPSTNSSERFLFFPGEPKYEIEVTTDDWVEDGVVLSTIEANLPYIFRPTSDAGCKSAFSPNPPNN